MPSSILEGRAFPVTRACGFTGTGQDDYVATGDLPANRAPLFHNRLNKAAAYLAQGKRSAYEAQLVAFGNQALDYATPLAADALEAEADRLATLP